MAKHFDSVDTKVDFSDLERKTLKDWEKSSVVHKYLNRNKSSKKYFSFLDGPITANNPMGVHHAWGRTYKDLWQRYKNMRGYKQRFQNGFDSQGLWVEVEVEKELGLHSKKDIENLVPASKKKSIAKFVKLCKKRVEKYAAVQTNQSKCLGYFMDWDNSYFTMSDQNNFMIWQFIKKCHEKGLIYKGRESVPWCPRCATAISQHEMLTEDYKEVVHKSIYFELPIVGRDREFLLVWTTTPWTLPANIAVAIDKKIKYLLVKGSTGDKFWVASDTVKKIFEGDVKAIKTAKGKDLVGLKYTWAFDDLLAVKAAAKGSKLFHTVVATDDRIMPITTDEGTGMVHTAVSAGTEDFKLGKKLGLPMIPVIEDDATYSKGLGKFSGKNAKKHPELILDYLLEQEKEKGANWVFKIHNYKHRYPGCWRCKTELVWRVVDEWYIAMDPLRADMKRVTKKIRWIPEFGLKRELDWLNNMDDWLISKKRYWGLALPIWECKKCKNFEVLGSKEELEEKAVEGLDKLKGHSPHKPWIDEIKIECSSCGELISRIPDVGNPWLDAGIVPYSTISRDNKGTPLFKKNEAEWEKWFPADFITESFPGQFKNWFYSMIAMSTVLTGRAPYKTVLGFATLLAEDGRAMHKSWGNSIEFNQGADELGVDVMRWMYVRQNPSENLLFGHNVARETRRRFHIKLWNVYNFFVTYANSSDWRHDNSNKLSRAALSDLDKWILARFNETLSNVTSRLECYDAYRASQSIETFVDDLSNWYIRRSRGRIGPSFYLVTHHVLTNLSIILAPFTPFLAENIYRNLTKNESVHLENWPTPSKIQDAKLITNMTNIREIVEAAHAARKLEGIPVRQPLSALSATSPFGPVSTDLIELIKEEVNVKNVVWKKGKLVKVSLNTKITPELKEEAQTRELIRKIQAERKKMGIDITQKVNVRNSWIPKSKKFIQNIKDTAGTLAISKGEFSVKKITS